MWVIGHARAAAWLALICAATGCAPDASVFETSVPQTPALAGPTHDGWLILQISGLPEGAPGSVLVQGPGAFSRVVTRTDTLIGLSTGTYAITLNPVVFGGQQYRGSDTSLVVSVKALAITTASVGYLLAGGAPEIAATVTLDPATRFQVVQGWEAVAQAGQTEPGFHNWRNAALDLAVHDLGLNRLRLEVRAGAENPQDHYRLRREGLASNWRCQRWETVNDNDDPNTLNPAGFHFSEVDTAMHTVVIPMRQRVAARGERLFLTLTYVAFLEQCAPMPYVHREAEEYAEFMLAAFRHLQESYGLTPDAVEMILEPDVGATWTPAMIGHAMLATRARLNAAGFYPEFTAPSTADMGKAVSWFDAIRAVPGMTDLPFTLSYHRYAGVSTANLEALGLRQRLYGVRTAMLERIGAGVEELFLDLTVAGVSAWQQYTLAFPGEDNGGTYYPVVGGQPVPGSRTRFLRQYFKYVRPGSQRIGAVSGSPSIRPVGFEHPTLGVAVVLHVGQAGTFQIRGLPQGTYGASITTAGALGLELPGQTVGASGTMTVSAPSQGILTVYRRP